MPIISNKNILGFELSIDDPITVKNFHTINDLGNKVSDNVFAELDLFLFQVKIYVALVQVLHNYVYFVLVLECFTNGD